MTRAEPVLARALPVTAGIEAAQGSPPRQGRASPAAPAMALTAAGTGTEATGPELAAPEFARLALRVKTLFGLHLPEAKTSLVRSRLLRRLSATGCANFSAYVDLLESSAGESEHGPLASALTTNVTHFFREKHHFDYLSETCLAPVTTSPAVGSRRLRFWSAGCSAGHEAYSMALTVLGRLPRPGDLRILATDIDDTVLARARAAVYPPEELEPIPAALRSRGLGPDGQLSAEARALVHVAQLNLVGEWPIRGPFDAIFCRNVAIYFDRPTQSRLWDRLTALLAPGGLLCIGHSERVAGPALDRLKPAGITAYRRSLD